MKPSPSKKERYAIIMAGGRGERFWPVSREKTPKQLITLLGKRSFLQQAVDRLRGVVPTKNILIITNQVQAAEVRRQLPKLPAENVVAEPCGRDTCAAVTLGAALVGARSRNGVMAVLPADHVIPDTRRFQGVLEDAMDYAALHPAAVTIGIQPTEPATGYGYIHFGRPIPPQPGEKRRITTFFEGKKFVEKPPRATAVRYLKSGKYRWNAGMFIWSFATIHDALERHQPAMAAACDRWMQAQSPSALKRLIAREYPSIEKISIDFALMEKLDNVVVADGAFPWDDLGAWTALARHLNPDPYGNCSLAELVQVDARNNIIFDGRTSRRTPIAMVGIKDTIVVLTDDATMIAAQSEAQKIKQLVAQLTESRKYRTLV